MFPICLLFRRKGGKIMTNLGIIFIVLGIIVTIAFIFTLFSKNLVDKKRD